MLYGLIGVLTIKSFGFYLQTMAFFSRMECKTSEEAQVVSVRITFMVIDEGKHSLVLGDVVR